MKTGRGALAVGRTSRSTVGSLPYGIRWFWCWLLLVLAPESVNASTDEAHMIILGGGPSREARRAWEIKKTEALEQLIAELEWADGLPRRIESDTVKGLNPGFHIVVAGYCSAPEAAAVLEQIRARIPGAYSREVELEGRSLACPRVLPVSSPGRPAPSVSYAIVLDEAATEAAAAETLRDFQILVGFRQAHGLRLSYSYPRIERSDGGKHRIVLGHCPEEESRPIVAGLREKYRSVRALPAPPAPPERCPHWNRRRSWSALTLSTTQERLLRGVYGKQLRLGPRAPRIVSPDRELLVTEVIVRNGRRQRALVVVAQDRQSFAFVINLFVYRDTALGPRTALHQTIEVPTTAPFDSPSPSEVSAELSVAAHIVSIGPAHEGLRMTLECTMGELFGATKTLSYISDRLWQLKTGAVAEVLAVEGIGQSDVECSSDGRGFAPFVITSRVASGHYCIEAVDRGKDGWTECNRFYRSALGEADPEPSGARGRLVQFAFSPTVGSYIPDANACAER